jgi:hypothetical protein
MYTNLQSFKTNIFNKLLSIFNSNSSININIIINKLIRMNFLNDLIFKFKIRILIKINLFI